MIYDLTPYAANSLIDAQNVTGAVNGTGVDLQGREGTVKVCANIGAVTGTGTITITIGESANNSDWTDTTYTISATDADASNALGIKEVAVDCRNVERYIRAQVAISGVTAVDLAVTGVVAKKYS